jgi:hypothetical protein
MRHLMYLAQQVVQIMIAKPMLDPLCLEFRRGRPSHGSKGKGKNATNEASVAQKEKERKVPHMFL